MARSQTNLNVKTKGSPTVDEQERLHREAWNEIEASVGGRFRDGAECPFVYDLFQLAAAEQGSAAQPDNADVLLEHLEVCGVCRRTYLAARQVNAGGEEEADDEQKSAQQSLLAELRESLEQSSHVNASTDDESDIAGVKEDRLSYRDEAIPSMALKESASEAIRSTVGRVWTLNILPEHVVTGELRTDADTWVRVRLHEPTVQVRLSGALQTASDDCFEIEFLDTQGGCFGRVQLDNDVPYAEVACDRQPLVGDLLVICCRSAAGQVHWQIRMALEE